MQIQEKLSQIAIDVLALSVEAGNRIMAIYKEPHDVITKEDDSPLTQADLASHRCLLNGLKKMTPDIPVLSEESPESVHEQRLAWTTYWLIDPLDGTREFIKRNGEFTVNVALIQNGRAILGVVHAPALKVSYWGIAGEGAFVQRQGAAAEAIFVADNPEATEDWKVVGSRSHQSPEFKVFMESLPGAEVVSMGSSLKLCLVAEGEAHLYPRLGPTSEWDTAAAQAVVEAAGGKVLEYPALTPLYYNRRPDTLLNPFFIVCAEPDERWAGSIH